MQNIFGQVGAKRCFSNTAIAHHVEPESTRKKVKPSNGECHEQQEFAERDFVVSHGPAPTLTMRDEAQ